jgi:uncharacterized protein
MNRILTSFLWLIAPLAMLLGVARAPAASFGVRDNAHFFSADAIKQAEQSIQQIQQRHHKDLLVETFPAVPDDLRARLTQEGKEAFFSGWTNQRAIQQGVNGVYILIVKDPGHLEVWDGNRTQQHVFPESAAQQLRGQLLAAFRNKQYDQGLIQAARFVQDQMDANVPASGSGAAVNPQSGGGGAAPGYPSFPGRVNRPSWGVGSIACVVIGVILVILLVRGIFGRSGSSFGGGGYYPPGGYPQGGGYPQAGYPPAGGYSGGGGGSGFGRGFLGGLLGGALGGYAADRYMHPGQGQTGGGYVPPATGGGDVGGGVDTGGTTAGGDFGSSGGDFGSSGGGDFGGGGGSDFGGGGDAGSSGGGDF